MDESWIRRYVEPTGPVALERERPWATIFRVPVAGTTLWFKACAPVQAFEPRLTAELSARWPDRVAEVIGYDEQRAWLLLTDAGIPLRDTGNRPESWLEVLPRYAELQRGEAEHADAHLAHGVPDLRVGTLPQRYDDLLRQALPLTAEEVAALRRYAPRFAAQCTELAARGVPASVQHDDLHMANVYVDGDARRVIDWGDASIGHPFASLVVTFRFLESDHGLRPDDPWFARLRDAYLEPWGAGHTETFGLALRLGTVAHAIAWARQRAALPQAWREKTGAGFALILRRALAQTVA